MIPHLHILSFNRITPFHSKKKTTIKLHKIIELTKTRQLSLSYLYYMKIFYDPNMVHTIRDIPLNNVKYLSHAT